MGVRHLLRRLGGSSGQTTVEFALLVPLLCVLLLLSVDLGRALLCWLDATHLANAGARAAAVDKPVSGATLQQWIRDGALTKDMRGEESTSSVPDPANVCIDFPSGTSGVGDPVKVSVSVDYHVISVPFMHFDGPTWTLTGSSTMRLEQAPTNYGAGCSA